MSQGKEASESGREQISGRDGAREGVVQEEEVSEPGRE